MICKGKAWKFADNIDTDVIIPVQYCSTIDIWELGRHCMEGLDPYFAKKVKAGDIIVAGKNFGCGSSREPAPMAIKGAGISCVIAESFARIFYRNAFNVGLPLLESKEAFQKISEGDELEIDLDTGIIRNLSKELSIEAKPIPGFMQELLRDGGLMKHIARRLNLENT